MNFVVVTSLATDTILATAYIDKNIEKINHKKGTLKATGWSPVTIEKSIGNVAYITNRVEKKKESSRDDQNECLCTAVIQKIIPTMSEVHLHVRSNAQGVRLVT